MKKKVLYGVFMALLAVFTMGTVQSCTDDLSDFEHQYQYDQYNLGVLLDQLDKKVGDCQRKCSEEITNIKNHLKNHCDSLDSISKDLKELSSKVATKVALDSVKSDVDSLKKYLGDNGQFVYDSISKVANALGALEGRVSTLEETVRLSVDSLREELNDAIAPIKAQLRKDSIAIAKNTADIKTHTAAIAEIQAILKDLEPQVAQNTTDIAQLKNLFNKMQDDLYDLQQKYEDLEDRVDDIEDELEILNRKFNALLQRFNDLITGILIQSADSPVFGNFSLPIGIQSNMLFNWYFYGVNKGEYAFPTKDASYAYDPDGQDGYVSDDDLKVMQAKGANYSVPSGFPTEGVNLGKVYLTINPVGHNLLDGKKFKLETSAGAAGRLDNTDFNVVESNTELYWGYSRSAANGFYEADVVVKDKDLDKVRITIDQDLKSAAKELLKNRTVHNGLHLLRTVYNQINGTFPRYGINASWEGDSIKDNGDTIKKNYSVLSKYDLAVTTARPLSYKFYFGDGPITDHRVRTFGHIDNLILRLLEDGDLHFNFNQDKIEINGLDIRMPKLTISASMNVTTTKVTATIEPIKVYSTETGQLIGESEQKEIPVDISSVTDDIQNAFDEAIASLRGSVDGWSDEVSQEINGKVDSMLDDIEGQINKMLDNISGQINDKIDDIITKYGNKAQPWFDRLNKLIDMYNKVANKINRIIEDPNAYLQPAMFYSTANNGIGIVSQSKDDPTVFTNAGGTAFTLYASSYTAEILAPAYKKLVACVNVFDSKTGNALSNGRDLAKAVNVKSGSLAVVLEGTTYGIAVPALESGKTYQFIYQALDYSGVTSTRKFYITVN